jgi:hypothetical protein
MLTSGDRSGVRSSKDLLPNPQPQGVHYFLGKFRGPPGIHYFGNPVILWGWPDLTKP